VAIVNDVRAALQFRRAVADDLPRIVDMLSDDVLGATRERNELPVPDSYFAAFAAIEADKNNEILVACRGGRIVGVLQLTFIPHLVYQGGWRAQIEGVRVDSNARSHGVGRAMIEQAIEKARERNCHLVQLTTNKQRAEARRFYEGLGFVATHEGMKLDLALIAELRPPAASDDRVK
jgi:ribosomal protein S18 acetylase RimI-like enzyme